MARSRAEHERDRERGRGDDGGDARAEDGDPEGQVDAAAPERDGGALEGAQRLVAGGDAGSRRWKVADQAVGAAVEAGRSRRFTLGRERGAAIAAAELIVALSESAEPLSEACDEPAIATTATNAELADEPPALARAPHLPLKRIRERFGKAPLKQVIASCPTLAK